jgi:hypothetical protein
MLSEALLKVWSGDAVLPANLATRIKHAALLALYLTWQRHLRATQLPAVASLGLATCAAPEQVFVADVLDVAPFTLQRTHIGAGLLELGEGAQLEGLLVADGEGPFAGLEAAYRRSVRRREASYEYLRVRLEAGSDVVFQRLLLPCFDPTTQRHQLVGMVMIDNLPQDPTR